ncbi:MAG: carbohydrate ABC transporter permease [bacterium]
MSRFNSWAGKLAAAEGFPARVFRALPSKRVKSAMPKLLIYIFGTSVSVMFLSPLLWMLSTAFKDMTQIFVFPPRWIPNPPKPENFLTALKWLNFRTTFTNTLIILSGTVIGSLFSSSIVGYSFAVLRWPGKNVFFVIMLSTMMIPAAVTLIPIFVVFNWLGWVNTFRPLIVPAWFGQPFFIFLLRQFFMSIPKELSDAAQIDGCGDFGIYWRIMLPLCKPVLAVVILFSFLNTWNDFFGPLIYLTGKDKWTLALALLATSQGAGWMADWGVIMAASFIVVVPVLIVFFFAQRYFVQGITMTGLKV